MEKKVKICTFDPSSYDFTMIAFLPAYRPVSKITILPDFKLLRKRAKRERSQ